MSLFIIIIFVLAGWHYVWEGIICPSLRMSLRNHLFALRDRVRRLRIDGKISHEEFSGMHEGINVLLPRLGTITISTSIVIDNAVKHDQYLVRSGAKKPHPLATSELPEVKEICAQITVVLKRALLCNSGSMAIYILPIVALVWCTRTVAKIVTLPATALAQLIPVNGEVTPERVQPARA